ncbi:MAG TPA: alcohol dehydrogenase catalytic domain-containing protein, partial [Armatimonadota bacterium]|nr:alcohol dehydrogenase catalytic domain-containing protein [Armatimonadota bacterium]
PCLGEAGDVVVRIVVAGICRTDVYAAEGRIPVREPVVLGHEFAGVVEAVAPGVAAVRLGDRVTAMPWVPCGECRECRSAGGPGTRCLRSRMLGVDRDGAFAEHVVVPAETLYRLPDSVSFTSGAYVEPVAASLAVLNAGLRAGTRGLVYGRNRIALLTLRVLAAHGVTNVALVDAPEAADLPDGEYDWAVETVATAESLRALVRGVRPGGKVVLKSRPCRPVELDVRAAVLKELTLHAVNYGSFHDAIALLAERRIDVTDLLGPVYPLEQWEQAFAESASSEKTKRFLAPSDEALP